MLTLSRFGRFLSRIFSSGTRVIHPVKAYDLWSEQYDNQPDNLVLMLEEQLFRQLIGEKNLRGAIIADVGCGTGRHWQTILDKGPARLVGFDVSQGMLSRLSKKFPGAETILMDGFRLHGLADQSCDLLVSTLALAHMTKPAEVFSEWSRVIRPGGEIIVTDFHPEALAMGSRRSFSYRGRQMAVQSSMLPLENTKNIAGNLGLALLKEEEIRVDESMAPYFEKSSAMDAFRRICGLPILYGFVFRKTDAPAKS